MNRSCEFCKWRTERNNFLGKINWCGANGEETQLDGYCENFRMRSTKK